MTTKKSRIASIIICLFFEIMTLALFFMAPNFEVDTFRWICIVPSFVLLFILCCSSGFKSFSEFILVLVGTWTIGCIIGLIIAAAFRNPTAKIVVLVIASVIIVGLVLYETIKLKKKDYI